MRAPRVRVGLASPEIRRRSCAFRRADQPVACDTILALQPPEYHQQAHTAGDELQTVCIPTVSCSAETERTADR